MITNDIETFYKNMEIHDKRKIARLEEENKQLKEQLENKIDLYEDTKAKMLCAMGITLLQEGDE